MINYIRKRTHKLKLKQAVFEIKNQNYTFSYKPKKKKNYEKI